MADKKLSQETNQLTDLTNDVKIYGIEDASGTPVSGYFVGTIFVYSAENGVNLDGKMVKLGGALIENTEIDLDAHTLTFKDATNKKGPEGDQDFSANVTDLNFVQKIYTDTHLIGKLTTIIDALNAGTGPGAAQDTYVLTWSQSDEEYILSAAGGGGGDFANGGEAGGENRTLGNTDAYSLGLKTNNTVQLSIASDGVASFSDHVYINYNKHFKAYDNGNTIRSIFGFLAAQSCLFFGNGGMSEPLKIFCGDPQSHIFLKNGNQGFVGFHTDEPTAVVDIKSDIFRLRLIKSPTPTETGTKGFHCWDTEYMYVCTSANNWKKTPLSTYRGQDNLVTKTSDANLGGNDHRVLISAASNNVTLTLPSITSALNGKEYVVTFINDGSGSYTGTLASDGSDNMFLVSGDTYSQGMTLRQTIRVIADNTSGQWIEQ